MKTQIVAVLDASGSMQSILDDSIGGFNAFLLDQRSDAPEDLMTVVFFDHNYKTAFKNVPLKDVKEMTRETYKLGGMTALYDAVGSTIDTVGQDLANMPESERPDKVMFVILTDGQENSSKEYTSAQVKERIDHQRNKYGWEFLFLAADERGLQDGLNMGISRDKSVTFTANSLGTQEAYATMSTATRSYRSSK